MLIKVKKLHENAVVPQYAKEGDAGLDLVAVDSGTEADYGKYIEYKTGLAFEIPRGYVGLLFPRSSVSNYTLSLANCVGVLDSGFRGEVSFRFRSTLPLGGLTKKGYQAGDKIGQLLVLPYPTITTILVDDLSETERGAGGYGSSGK